MVQALKAYEDAMAIAEKHLRPSSIIRYALVVKIGHIYSKHLGQCERGLQMVDDVKYKFNLMSSSAKNPHLNDYSLPILLGNFNLEMFMEDFKVLLFIIIHVC